MEFAFGAHRWGQRNSSKPVPTIPPSGLRSPSPPTHRFPAYRNMDVDSWRPIHAQDLVGIEVALFNAVVLEVILVNPRLVPCRGSRCLAPRLAALGSRCNP